VVDIWTEYARLRDDEGWDVEQICRVKRIGKTLCYDRLALAQTPGEFKVLFHPGGIDEKHGRELLSLKVRVEFSPWLTTSNLWVDLANLTIEKKLSVSQLKKEVDQWKKVIAKAGQYYDKLTAQIEIGEEMYHPKNEYVATLSDKKARERRMQAEGKPRGEKKVSLETELSQETERKSATKAAKTFGISSTTVKKAKKVAKVTQRQCTQHRALC